MSNLKSASSNLLTCKVSSKNNKKLNLGPNIPHLGIFGLQFSKNHYQIFNQHTLLCETIKFHAKQKTKKKKREQNYPIGIFGWNVEKL